MTTTLHVELHTTELVLAPAQPASVGVRVRNTGGEPLVLTLRIAGLDTAGGAPGASLGTLAPGAALTTTVHFALPAETAAGDRLVAVQVLGSPPAGRPGQPIEPVSATAHLRLRVGSTSRLALRLARAEVDGRRRGKLVADLHNQGTEQLDLRLWGEGADVTVAFERAELTLPAGHSTRVRGTVRTGGFTWRRAERRAFVVTAQGNTTPATTAGSYVQKGLLPGALTTALAVLLVLALWVTGLVWLNNRLRSPATVHGSVASSEDGTGIPTGGSGSDGSGGGAGGTGAGGTGADGTGGAGGSAGGAGGEGGASALTQVPIAVIGTVDGPSDRVGTSAVLDPISLGTTTPPDEPTKLAAFTSVRRSAAAVAPPQRTSTDADGRFRFNDIGSSPGLYRLTVFRPGFDVSSQVLQIDGSTPNVEVAVKLTPAAGGLSGAITDNRGNAIGGATITVTATGPTATAGTSSAPTASSLSSRSGLRSTGGTSSAAGDATTSTTVAAGSNATNQTDALSSSGALQYSTVTDDGNGSWRLDGVATPATYVVRITKDSFASASLIVTLDGGQAKNGLSVGLVPGAGTVHGIVQSGFTGVGALSVTLASSTAHFTTTTRTDDPVGAFEEPGMPLGIYALTIEGDGWQTYASQIELTSGDLDLGIIGDMRRSSATVSGVVRQQVVSSTSNGVSSSCTFPEHDDDPAIELRPCGGVGITATNGEHTYRTTSSTGDGSYLLTGMLPGTYSMSFERAGYSTVLFTTTVAAGDVVDLATTDLTMLPTGNLANGAVRMFVGSVANLPLTGITAQVIGQQGGPTPFPTAPSGTTPILLTGLLPGTYNVRISADEHDTALAQIQVPQGVEVNGGTVLLTPLASIGGLVSGFQSLPVPNAVVFVTPDPTDPNAASLLITPKGTPANPDGAYLDADPAVGEVRRCQRNVAPAGSAADVRQGLCTTTSTAGRYDFVRLMRTGKYLVYAPMNNVVDDSSQVALDHTLRSFSVLTTVGQQSNLDLALVRYGAIVGSIRTPDPTNGTDFIDLTGVEVTATFCQQTPGSSSATDCVIPPTDPLAQQPKGRVSFGANGTYRVDRLPPPGTDPATGVPVASYLVRFHKDGLADQYRVVSAPSLNEERLLDVVMLPEPTQVRITPYWTNAEGGARQEPIGATVTVSGIVDYTTSPLAPVSGTASGPLLGGTFDSKPTTFKSGSITVTVVAPGFAPASTTISLLVPGPTDPPNPDIVYEVHPGGTTILTANVAMSPTPRTVSGNLVVNCCNTPALSNLPISQAPVVFAAMQARLQVGSTTYTAPLTSSGAYSFSNVPPGHYTLTFAVDTTNDTHQIFGNIDLPAPFAVTVNANADFSVPVQTARLHPAVISGRVLDEDNVDGAGNNLPVAGAEVTIPEVPAVPGVPSPKATTDVNGNFSLTVWDVPRDMAVVITKNDGRQPTTFPGVTFNPGGRQQRDFVIAGPKGSIAGEVRGRDNTAAPTAPPLGGVTITLTDGGAPAGTTTSSATGTFSIPGLRAGTNHDYRLTFSRPGYVSSTVAVSVSANQTTFVTVELQAAGRSVGVVVVSQTQVAGADVPLGGVTVSATLTGIPTGPTNVPVVGTTDANGQVALSLRPGNWSLVTSGGAVATVAGVGTAPHTDNTATVAIAVGTDDVAGPTIRLAGPFASASGIVVGKANPAATAVPIAGATVTITTSRGSVTAETDSTGAFGFAGRIPVDIAASTPYQIAVDAPAGYDDYGPVAGTPDLPISPSATIGTIVVNAASQGTVVEVSGREAAAPLLQGVLVTASLQGAPDIQRAGTTGADGRTSLALQPGTWTLVTSNGASATTGTPPVASPHGDVGGSVSVSLGATPPVTTLRPNVLVTVSMHVLSVHGGDVPGLPPTPMNTATVVLTRTDVPAPPEPITIYPAASVDANGNYRVAVTPGPYRVDASAAGYTPFATTLTVAAGAPPSLEFTLIEQPMTLSGQVISTDGTTGIRGVTVRYTTTIGTQQFTGVTVTDINGFYAARLAAGLAWTVAFDPSTSPDPATQAIPVLYRYVGPVAGGSLVTLNHSLFTDVVALEVTVKGVLPGCTAPCATHDLPGAAALTLTDAGTDVDGRQRVVTFVGINTTSVGGVQIGTFASVPRLLTNLTLVGKAGGYSDASLAVNTATLPESSCTSPSPTKRCVELDLAAISRAAAVTVTDDAVQPVGAAAVAFRPAGTTTVAGSCTTSAAGTCTTPPLPPLFGAYGHYDVVVTPGDTTHGQRIVTADLPPGTGSAPIAVTGVPLLPRVATQPTDQRAWVGDPATFVASVAGSRPMTAQWQVSTNGGTSFADIPGASTVVSTGAATANADVSYNLPATAADDDGHRFRVVVTRTPDDGSPATTVQSNAVALTVLPAPVLTSGPVDVNLAATATDTMTAVADGPAGVGATATWETAPSADGPWTGVPAGQITTTGLGHVTSTFDIAAAVADGTNVRVALSFTPPGLAARSTPQSAPAVVHRAPPPTTAEATTTTAATTTTTAAPATSTTTTTEEATTTTSTTTTTTIP